MQTGWSSLGGEPTSTGATLGDLDRFGTEIPWVHQDLPASVAGSSSATAAPLPLDQVAQAAADDGASGRFTIHLPVDGEPHHEGTPPSAYGAYTIANHWPQRADDERTIYLDQFSGQNLGEYGADQCGTVGWVASWGIDAHMGTQLGIVSRTLMTLVCAGLLTSTGSALVMFRDASGPVG